MKGTYWDSILQKRLTRRRALVGSSTAGLAAAFLAACGGDDDDDGDGGTGDGGGTSPTQAPGQPTQSSGLVSSYVDTTEQATKGGIWQNHAGRDSDHFDANTGTQATLAHTILVYSRLLGFEQGTVFDPPTGTVFPDTASSYEVSGDGLQVVLKLRPEARFDERPPTNGRPVTTADVKYSFDRFAELSPNRGNVLNSINPEVPIEGLTYPDEGTVVVHLVRPDASILSMLAWAWFLNVMPVEAEDQFNTSEEMRGSGPWMLTEYTPSVGWTYRRNPTWWRANERPFFDGIDIALIPETAAIEAQFTAQTLWRYEPTGEKALLLKQDNPDAGLFMESPFIGNSSYRAMHLSKRPESPIQQDVRIRRALSMLIDRDLVNEINGNISGFAAEGIEVEGGWHSHAPMSWNTVWLDPKEGELGEASQYFHHNPAEAEKLLRAADSFGMETKFASWSPMPSPWERHVEIVAEMLEKDGHFSLNREVLEYRTDYQPNYFRSTLFEGIGNQYLFPGLPDFNMTIWNTFSPGARSSAINDWNDVPGLREIMIRHRDERDPEKQVEIAHEWQQLLASEMPIVPYYQNTTSTFSMAWPWFGNWGVPRVWGGSSGEADTWINLWYNEAEDFR